MKNYYHCILEVDIDEGCMPVGSDYPLRRAIEKAATNLHESAYVINNWSGWGLTESGAMKVLDEACKEENTITIDEVNKRSYPQITRG